MKKEKEFSTIREFFYYTYSNLAMAHMAIRNNIEKYDARTYPVRTRMYRDFLEGKANLRTLFSDEEVKLKNHNCAYCGTTNNLSLDHLIPRYSGGRDNPDNLVYACKSCNSSKGKNDLILWYLEKNSFPPILVLRRYLKLAFYYLESINALDEPYSKLKELEGDYKIHLLPLSFPQPKALRL